MTWTEPGTFPVAPGVHRIPLPLPDDGLRVEFPRPLAREGREDLLPGRCGHWTRPAVTDAAKADDPATVSAANRSASLGPP